MLLTRAIWIFVDKYAPEEADLRRQFVADLRRVMNSYATAAILKGDIPESKNSAELDDC